MFRLRHSSGSGFPVRASIAVCHALRLTPPSSNRTCGFPASGSPGDTRIRHAQAVARYSILKHRWPPAWPVCQPPSSAQSVSAKRRYPVRLSPLITASGDGFRSRAIRPSGSPSVHESKSPVRPLRSASIMRFLRYYEPLRFPTGAVDRVMYSSATLRFSRAPSGLPGSSTELSVRAVPYHPGEPGGCLHPFLHRRCWLHPIWKTGHSHKRNEAGTGSLALRLAPLPRRGFAPVGLLRPAPAWLHVNGPFTWWAPFSPQVRPGLSWRTRFRRWRR